VVASPIAARLLSVIPPFHTPLLSIVATFLATLAACIAYRPPIFNRGVAKRITNLRLLATRATRHGYCKNQQNK